MKIVLVTIIFFISSFASVLETCVYVEKASEQNKYPELNLYENCAEYTNGKLTISPDHIQKIDFRSSGLAAFWTENQCFYIKKDGSFLPVISYDNGADYFSEGLTRSLVKDKIAYYNPKFEMVIESKYDWGWPFSEGRALVCIGCSAKKPDEFGNKPVTGGVWGYINKKGKELVPVKYSQSEVRFK